MKAMSGVNTIKSGATYTKSKNQILVGPAAFSETSKAISSFASNQGRGCISLLRLDTGLFYDFTWEMFSVDQ